MWFNGAEATALRQTCITDVQVMRRRIRRGIDLHQHTHALYGGDYSERGLEHLISADVYQEVTAEQTGAIQAVLAAQDNTRRGSSGLLAQISADRSQRARERAERLGRADAEEAALLNLY